MSDLNPNNDKAIEYAGVLAKTYNMLENIESLGVDVSVLRKEVERIDTECKNDASKTSEVGLSTVGLAMQEQTYQSIYIKATIKLEEVQFELHRHEVYFMSKNLASSLQESLKAKKFNEEMVEKMANVVIVALRNINNSDTRPLDSERLIVESLYNVAFEIMKLEVRFFNKSKIVAWAKDNQVGYLHLNNLVRDYIDAISDKPKKLNELLCEIHAREGSDADYLNIDLLRLLVSADLKEEAKRVSSELAKLQKEIKEYDKEIENAKSDAKGSERDLEGQREKRKEKLKYIGKVFIYAAVIAALIPTYFKVSPLMTRQEHYKTVIEQYSSNEEALPVDAVTEEYRKKADDSITIKKYEAWEWTEHVLDSDRFERTVTTYELEDLYLEDLQSYKTLDLEALKIKGETSTETKESLIPQDLYEDVIISIERIIQDEDDSITVENKAATIGVALGLWAATVIALGLTFCWLYDEFDMGLFEDLYWIKKGDYPSKKVLNEKLRILKEKLEKIEALKKSRTDLEDKFQEIYHLYAENITDENLKKTYQTLVRRRQKPEEESR